MITTYATCADPRLPDTLQVDNVHYRRREILARNVRPGDRVVIVDLTLPSGVGLWGTFTVTGTDTRRAGRGRSYLPPWQRRTLYVDPQTFREGNGYWPSFRLTPWEEVRNGTRTCAPMDRLTVYRPEVTS